MDDRDQLWTVITNVLADQDSRCLDDVEDRAAVRDALVATLSQTFTWKPAPHTD
jgi:hypothetical protein